MGRISRCYICGKELDFAKNISIRFTKKKQRMVHSRGFFSIEKQKDGTDKAKWNEPYTTDEYAQTAIGSFCTCNECGMTVYESIKRRVIMEGSNDKEENSTN